MPQTGDLFLPQTGDAPVEVLCFDTDLARGKRGFVRSGFVRSALPRLPRRPWPGAGPAASSGRPMRPSANLAMTFSKGTASGPSTYPSNVSVTSMAGAISFTRMPCLPPVSSGPSPRAMPKHCDSERRIPRTPAELLSATRAGFQRERQRDRPSACSPSGGGRRPRCMPQDPSVLRPAP